MILNSLNPILTDCFTARSAAHSASVLATMHYPWSQLKTTFFLLEQFYSDSILNLFIKHFILRSLWSAQMKSFKLLLPLPKPFLDNNGIKLIYFSHGAHLASLQCPIPALVSHASRTFFKFL